MKGREVDRFEGKTAVVTGGGTNGIGRAAAARLVEEGAHVFITGRRENELDEAVAAIGRNVTAIPGDITKPADLERLFAAVEGHGTGLDVLFANAGVATFAKLEELTEEDHVFGINVVGTMLTVQRAIPLLNPGGSVIINVSTAADRGAPPLVARRACSCSSARMPARASTSIWAGLYSSATASMNVCRVTCSLFDRRPAGSESHG